MLDVIILVSSDPQISVQTSALSSLGVARETITYRNGIDLLDVLQHEQEPRNGLVVIDANCGPIPAYNLIDAVRTTAPQMRVILLAKESALAAGEASAGDIEKAMLAGASGVVSRSEDPDALCTMVRRVASSHVTEQSSVVSERHGRVIACIGARGGAGRSTVACLLSEVFASRGQNVALVDYDLQFGDLGFLFNRTKGPTLYDLMRSTSKSGEESISHFGRKISDYVTLFAPEASPEKAELMYGEVRTCTARIAAEYDVVILNTGAFWTVFQAEVLDASDHVVCITDQSVVGARSTKQLMDLCEKLQIPARRFTYVANRLHPYGLSGNDIASGLGIKEVFAIPAGGDEFALLAESGKPRVALERYSDVEAAVTDLALRVADRAGIAIDGQAVLIKGLRDESEKRRWWSWR